MSVNMMAHLCTLCQRVIHT